MLLIKSLGIFFLLISHWTSASSLWLSSMATAFLSLSGLWLWVTVSPALRISSWLSCDLCCLFVADLDISQTENSPPHDSNPHGPQLQTFIAEAKLSLQRVTTPDGETGDGEENIVYLWLCYFSKQNKTLAFWRDFFFSFPDVCMCVTVSKWP